MRILIVNDDSVTAPGIALLAEAASRVGEVTVVAPEFQCSAMSQRLTIREPLTLKRAEGFPVPVSAAYSLDGTPVDCVKVALRYILDEKPDWVFSGINNGYNVGYDIAYSGTLGAAFEAARSGVPAIAFSSAGDKHLSALQPHLDSILRHLLDAGTEEGTVWNVNFPPLASKPLEGVLWNRSVARTSLYEAKFQDTPQPDGSIQLHNVGVPVGENRIGQGTDAEAVRKGFISIGKVKA